MFWRTLLTTTSTSHVVREGESVEDESGEDKQAFNYIILLNQGKWNKVFHKVENGALVSLGSKGTGMFPRDEKILSGSSSLKNSVSKSVRSKNSSAGGWAMAKAVSGATLGQSLPKPLRHFKVILFQIFRLVCITGCLPMLHFEPHTTSCTAVDTW